MKGSYVVSQNEHNLRLDAFFLQKNGDLTRSFIKNKILSGEVKVNGKKVKAGYSLRTGDKVEYEFSQPKPLDVEAEDIDYETIYQDGDLLVINKPQGLVVHPCSSTKNGTLVNGLLAKVKDLSGINGVLRPGIVHRLDKNTSGLMLVAKNDFAHNALALQIKNKTCARKYLALVDGNFKENEGRIETYIARSKTDRKKMCVASEGRLAITDYIVKKRFTKNCLVEFSLKTGRTHQIRVHCKHLGHPVVGDDVYGKKIESLKGQLLHSYYISFIHPRTQKRMEFTCPLPQYFSDYISKLKEI